MDSRRSGPFSRLPCNTWTWCGEASCFEPDAHKHSFGNCWLKFAEDPHASTLKAPPPGTAQSSTPWDEPGGSGWRVLPQGEKPAHRAPRPARVLERRLREPMLPPLTIQARARGQYEGADATALAEAAPAPDAQRGAVGVGRAPRPGRGDDQWHVGPTGLLVSIHGDPRNGLARAAESTRVALAGTGTGVSVSLKRALAARATRAGAASHPPSQTLLAPARPSVWTSSAHLRGSLESAICVLGAGTYQGCWENRVQTTDMFY